jgi:hypothetical protein
VLVEQHLAILLFELPKPLGVTHLRPAVLLLAPIQRVLADAVLPAHFQPCILQDADDLALREPALPHLVLLFLSRRTHFFNGSTLGG